jgi:predicted transcriptional regulator
MPGVGVIESREASLARLLRSRSARLLYDAIQREPGQTLTRLSSTMGLGWGGTYHHMRKLEEAGFVVRHHAGRAVRVFPAGTPRTDMDVPWLGETAQLILVSIRSGAPRTASALATELGLAPSVLYYHLRRLSEAGLVQRKAYRYGAVQISPSPEPEQLRTSRPTSR